MRPRTWTPRAAAWTSGSYRVERIAADFWVLTRGHEVIDSAGTARELTRRPTRAAVTLRRRSSLTFAVFLVSLAALVAGSFIDSWVGVVSVVIASLATCGSAIRLSEQFVHKHPIRRRSPV